MSGGYPDGFVHSLGSLYDMATDPMPDTGCRLMRLHKGTEYPRVRSGGRLWRAHRLALALSLGVDDLPADLVARHRCPAGPNPKCINAKHLVPGTRADNNRDMIEDGTHVSAFVDGRCKRGHDITDSANLYVYRDGKRQCRQCQRANGARWKRRRRALAAVTIEGDGQLSMFSGSVTT